MTASHDFLSRRPEHMVITGFRNIMAACELGDMHCWEAVWQHYIAEVGTSPARRMVGDSILATEHQASHRTAHDLLSAVLPQTLP